MKKVAFIFVLTAVFVACSKNTVPTTSEPRSISPRQLGIPSLAGISEHARGEAMAAFEHAKQFISTSGVDAAKFKVSKSEILIFHRPGSWPVDYDWSVQFSWDIPSIKSSEKINIAVKNNGTCWLLR